VKVAEVVGQTMAGLGVDHVFGVVGSGNFHVTNALVAGGARFVAARHEGGAATMADAYARVSGTVAAVTVHQGCGLTNALTGITEAAKSRTPLVVLAAETTAPRSNFFVDQAALATAVGAVACRVTSPETAVAESAAAFHVARDQRRTVLLNLPLELQGQDVPDHALAVPPAPEAPSLAPDPAGIAQLVDALKAARRPVFIAGRGARSHAARDAIAALAERTGALLATSAVARGLFHSHPFTLDVSGGFASPLAAELITDADLIVGWGCSMNMWTMRHGRLIGAGATVAQVDIESGELGANRPIDIGIAGDAADVARRVAEDLHAQDHHGSGYRSEDLAHRLESELRWRDVPYDDDSTEELIDPRTLSIGLDDVLPAERILAIDSGNFMGYPSMFLSVPDEQGMCFTQAYQSIGLGLATAIGAALGRPDRLPVAALGDGGALMGIAELDTVVRLGISMMIVVYNDDGYGAEVHHFADGGHPMDTVTFPDTDIAAIGTGFGCDSVTVRGPGDLDAVRKWVQGPRERPLMVDAKVTRAQPSWWLEEAFRGH
jgi:acetolactate synthase-1/2/3 large subunit